MNITSTRLAVMPVKASVVESKEKWHVDDSVFNSTDELLNVEQEFEYTDAVFTWSDTHKADRAPTLKERGVHSLKSSARTGFAGAIVGTAVGAVAALASSNIGMPGVALAAGGGALLGGAYGLYQGVTTNPLHYTDSGSLNGKLNKTEEYASFSVDQVVENGDRSYFNLTDDNVSEMLKANDLQGTHERVYHPF